MRIAIVNDMPMALEGLRRLITTSTTHEIAWMARDGAEAVALCARDRPDLILMDLIMPVLDGAQATRQIMAATPCPILIVTATVKGNSAKVYEALGAGAFDAVNTPALNAADKSESALLSKIDLIREVGQDFRGDDTQFFRRPPAPAPKKEHLFAIGASAGGPAALAEVLTLLPAQISVSIVIIQHIDKQFAPGLADWLGKHCKIPVRLARQGNRLGVGEILVAGTNDHLVFTDPHVLGYSIHPSDYSYRPSVDVFFASAARHWRGTITGVLLTGMGRDGAAGLKTLRDAGHHTIAQDRATCAVYGMPKAAAAIQAAVEILPLQKIGAKLRDLASLKT